MEMRGIIKLSHVQLVRLAGGLRGAPASPYALLQQHTLKAHTQGQQGFIDNLRAAIPIGTNIEAAFRKEKGGRSVRWGPLT